MNSYFNRMYIARSIKMTSHSLRLAHLIHFFINAFLLNVLLFSSSFAQISEMETQMMYAAGVEQMSEPIVALSRPPFRMYGITSGPHPSLTDAQLKTFAEAFYIIHGLNSKYFNKIAYMKGINPEIKFIEYMNSTYVWNVLDNYDTVGDVVETKHKHAIAMAVVAWVQQAITAEQTQFVVYKCNFKGGKYYRIGDDIPVAIVPSTVSGNFSATDLTGNTNFVFWIRMGNELMKVTGFDRVTGTVTVVRGFNGTTPSSHAAGNLVFAPVYIGSVEGNPFHGPLSKNGNIGLRYALDPRITDANILRGVRAMEIMNKGLDGIWLDIFTPGFFNQANCLAERVQAWDFTTNAVYTPDEWRYWQEVKAKYFQDYIFENKGIYPVIVGNNQGPEGYFEGQGGTKFYMMHTEVKPMAIQGMCNEGIFKRTGAEWKAAMKMFLDAAKLDLPVMPIMGDAGANGQKQEWPDTPERDKKERYSYATFLLAVEKNSKMMMGTYPFYKDSNGNPFFRIHKQYYYPVGEPAETLIYSNLDNYRMPGTGVYKRAFTNALVLVNPGTITENVVLDKEYLDPDNGNRVSAVSMPAASGKILLINNTLNSQPPVTSGFTLYPNPASDFVLLRTDHKFTGNHSYELYDLTGKLIAQRPITEKETRVALDHLLPGIYCLLVKQGAYKPQIIKLIKTNP
jgi:hypothetical protein